MLNPLILTLGILSVILVANGLVFLYIGQRLVNSLASQLKDDWVLYIQQNKSETKEETKER